MLCHRVAVQMTPKPGKEGLGGHETLRPLCFLPTDQDFADLVNEHLKSQGKEARHAAVIQVGQHGFRAWTL